MLIFNELLKKMQNCVLCSLTIRKLVEDNFKHG